MITGHQKFSLTSAQPWPELRKVKRTVNSEVQTQRSPITGSEDPSKKIQDTDQDLIHWTEEYAETRLDCHTPREANGAG